MQIAPSMGMLGPQTAQILASPPAPLVLQCESHFKGFSELAWANMGQKWRKSLWKKNGPHLRHLLATLTMVLNFYDD